MSNDQNNSIVVNHGGDLAFQDAPVQREYGTSTSPRFDSSRAKAISPQIVALLVVTALKRTWKWALFLGLVASTAGAGLVWFLMPVHYEAKSVIYAAQTPEHLIYKSDGGVNAYAAFIATQWDLIHSNTVMKDVLADNKVSTIPAVIKSEDPLKMLVEDVKLSRKPDSSFFTISYRDKNPQDAYAVVAAVTEAYLVRQKENLEDTNNRILELLKNERAHYETLVKTTEKQIKDKIRLAAEQGGGGTAEGLGQGLQQDSLVKDYYLAEAQLRSLEVELKVDEEVNTQDREIPEFLLRNRIETDPAYQSQQAYMTQLAARISSLTRKVSSKDPSVVRLKAELDDANGEFKALVKRLEGEITKKIRDEFNYELEMRKLEKSARIESQKILVRELKNKYDEQIASHAQSNTEVADVTFQMAQLNRHNRTLELLNERFVALTTEKQAPQRVRKLQDAEVPIAPIQSPRIVMTIIAGFGLFFAPFALGIALEFMKPKVYHVSQIRNAVPGLLIGEIMEPPVAWLHGAAFRRRLARYRESVNNWCTHLLLADPFRHCQTMAVASVAGDDGKTFLAIQVVSAMAQMKSGPVLLIDGDMRIGRLHLLFGNEEPGPGLADVLSFRKGIGEAVTMNEKEPNLHLLSAGNLDVSPYEILGDGRFRELLDALSTHYSMIMVVVPPVAHAAESLMLASSVDSVILCVRQGVTVMAAMEDVYRKLVATGSHVDGIVVKDIPYSHMAGKDGGFSDKIEQIRLAHLLKQTEAF